MPVRRRDRESWFRFRCDESVTDPGVWCGAPACYTPDVAIVLSLASALMYGVSDFVGGRASRRVPPVAVAFLAEVVMLPLAIVVIPLVEPEGPTAGAVWWGMAAGLTGSIGVLGLYVALARGNMTVVAPVTGVVAAVVPVAVGVALGERPGGAAVTGIVLAVVAVALIGGVAQLRGGGVRVAIDPGTVVLAIGVGALFGLLFVAFAQTGDDAGLWPLLFARFGGAPALAAAFWWFRRRRGVTLTRAALLPGLAVGLLVVGANAAYLLATREGLLSVVAVVVAMYPAGTIGLATLLDGERPSRSQLVGMAMAAPALLLITVG
jgi:drug/metabolite transporter (DMT)-like permease